VIWVQYAGGKDGFCRECQAFAGLAGEREVFLDCFSRVGHEKGRLEAAAGETGVARWGNPWDAAQKRTKKEQGKC